MRSIHDPKLGTGRPDVSGSTALGEDRSFHESDLFVENLEVAVAPDGYPINCDIQPSTAHAETLLSQHLGSNDLDMGLLNELLSFDQSVDSFEFLTDMVENDAASPFSIDQNSVDSSPGRTMDLVYYLEDNCNADIPSAVGRSCGIIHPNTRDADDASQDHWPTKYAAQRYLRAFFDSFHRHIPLLHIPTYLERQPPGPLQLAVYAIGALHAFNQVAACDLYHAGHEKLLKETSTLPALERMQTLLLLAMFASWSDDDSLRAESIPLQSQLAAVSTLLTNGIKILMGFRNCVTVQSMLHHLRVALGACGWRESRSKGSHYSNVPHRRLISQDRTILNIMCFLGVMNVALLSSTVFLPPNFDIELPYSEELWVCNNREEWERLFSSAPRPQTFTVAFHNLTSLSGSILHNDCGLTYLVLMVALYNHVKSCRGLASSLPISLGQEIVNTNISSLNRWLLSLTESKILRPQQHIFADSSLAASALILWKTTMLLLHADPASVADVQDAILTLSLGHDKAVPPWNPAHKTCNVAPAMGHAVSFIQAPVVRGVQFLQATACMSISIYHGLLGFHGLILLVRWISSLESSNEQIDEQSIHSDELLLLRDIRVLITESDLPSLDRLPLSVACARMWAETLQSDRQIWGIRTVLHTYLQKLI